MSVICKRQLHSVYLVGRCGSHTFGIETAMKVLVVHGQYDTVTPYFASKRLMHQSRLKVDARLRVTEKLYEGGHMFYSWHEQRRLFSEDVRALIQSFD